LKGLFYLEYGNVIFSKRLTLIAYIKAKGTASAKLNYKIKEGRERNQLPAIMRIDGFL